MNKQNINFLISQGNYSEYKVIAILHGPADSDLGQLLREFNREFHLDGVYHCDLDDFPWYETGDTPNPLYQYCVRNHLGVVTHRPSGNVITQLPFYDGHQDAEIPVFCHWLMIEKGFTSIEHVEYNFD